MSESTTSIPVTSASITPMCMFMCEHCRSIVVWRQDGLCNVKEGDVVGLECPECHEKIALFIYPYENVGFETIVVSKSEMLQRNSVKEESLISGRLLKDSSKKPFRHLPKN